MSEEQNLSDEEAEKIRREAELLINADPQKQFLNYLERSYPDLDKMPEFQRKELERAFMGGMGCVLTIWGNVYGVANVTLNNASIEITKYWKRETINYNQSN